MTKTPLSVIGLFQALGLSGYCALVALIFWQGEKLFGRMANYLGQVVFLILFVNSALICALIVFYNPYMLFFKDKKKEDAIQLVAFTTGWLLMFVILGLFFLALR